MTTTDQQTQSFLDALERGEIAAALVLADSLQDAGHPHADRVALLAQRLQATESFLECFEILFEIREILTEV
jgi:hypothetical protein